MARLHTIAMTVNGQTYEGKLEARVTLADFLRHHGNPCWLRPRGLWRMHHSCGWTGRTLLHDVRCAG
jgi:hypothetical protein